jgi:hypothetical protein
MQALVPRAGGRLSPIRGSSPLEQTGSDHDPKEKDEKKLFPVFGKPYHGDLFGSRGNNTNGMLFLSRMGPDPFAVDHGGGHAREIDVDHAERKCSFGEFGKSKHEDENIAGWRKCSNAIEALSWKEKKLDKIVHDGALNALVVLAKTDDSVTRANCAKAWQNFARHQKYRQLIVDGGFVPSIVALAQTEKGRAKQDSLATLCYLAATEGLEGRLVIDGVASAIGSIRGNGGKSIVELACMTLLNLASALRPYPKKEMLIETTLVALRLGLGAWPSIILLRGLCNLACQRPIQLRIIEESAVRVLVKLSDTVRLSDAPIKYLTCIAFNLLAECHSGRKIMIDQRIIPCLIQLSRDEHPHRDSQPTICGLALAKLCLGTESRMVLATNTHLVEEIIALCSLAHQGLRRACVAALHNLSSEDCCRTQLVNSRGLLLKVMALHEHDDPRLKQRCALLFSNLCFFYSGKPSSAIIIAFPS